MSTSLTQPTGTVTFVFTDIEGSTALLRELGAEAYLGVLGEHRRILRGAFSEHDGYEAGEEGDAFFFAFASAEEAVAAVSEGVAQLADGPVRIRVGVHTGEPLLDPPSYVGEDVHLAARVMNAGHGGQVLLSGRTRELVEVEVRELGRHGLKDFPEAVALFQLGTERFPPLRTISNTNLPRPASSFVGRERELTEVVSLVHDDRGRLVTLLGPGGTGKTRLALESAAELVSDFGAGVFWVGLAAVRDPALVMDTVAETLGAKQPLADHVGDRELLIVLDNLEQVVAAAPDLSALLRACPNLRMVTTSRELLRVEGEVAYSVMSLADEEAVELFCARSGVEPSEAIAELCRRLDNLPLAVELAAARVSVLSPEQILGRLPQRLDLLRGGRDADPRQETLRSTIAWSADLLAEDEKQLFARLAVFSDGCTLEAAEQVADAQLDTLQALIEKSLLRRRGERFWMLETIREFAGDLLAEIDQADPVADRLAEFFLAMAERAYDEQFDPGADGLEHLTAEQGNLRAALDHWRERDAARFCELAAALGWYWQARAESAEATRRLSDAIALAAGSKRALARALRAAANISSPDESVPGKLELLERSGALWLELGDEQEWGETLRIKGYILVAAGDYTTARFVFEETLELARRLDDPLLITRTLRGICQVLVAVGDAEWAQPLAEELSNSRDSGTQASGHHFLADCALYRAEYALARSHYVAALELHLDSGRVGQATIELLGVAFATAGLGRHEQALRLEGAVDGKREEQGMSIRVAPFFEAWRTQLIGAARGALGDESADALYANGKMLEWEEATALALERS
jgi:predicted ATPase/class 3 adenylate cyclase